MRTKPIDLSNYNKSDTALTAETRSRYGDKILYVIGIMSYDSATSICQLTNTNMQEPIKLAMEKAGYGYTKYEADFDWSDVKYNKERAEECDKVLFEMDAHKYFKRITIEKLLHRRQE